MKRIVVRALLVAMFMMTVAFVVQVATPEDAKVLTEKAVSFWKANGKDKAIAAFNDPKGQFVKGDLYVTVQGFDGVLVAHGGNRGLVGKNVFEQKDPVTGKFIAKEMIEIAKTKGSGWFEYNWVNPVTKKIQMKKSWIAKVEGEDYIVNCGAFK